MPGTNRKTQNKTRQRKLKDKCKEKDPSTTPQLHVKLQRYHNLGLITKIVTAV